MKFLVVARVMAKSQNPTIPEALCRCYSGLWQKNPQYQPIFTIEASLKPTCISAILLQLWIFDNTAWNIRYGNLTAKVKKSELHAYKDGAKTCKCLAQEQDQQNRRLKPATGQEARKLFACATHSKPKSSPGLKPRRELLHRSGQPPLHTTLLG
ncbi:unnamed protein product [Vicia faba]|uniref:Uncharacterized protein n=1 Tax=Vicia faba TaxID=3906 RepID=A0AAV1AGK4_VICFA|nr:unnamed protein product [Vicia faba]